MVEYMLADVICHEFDRAAGKDQHEQGKALHVGFGLNTGHTTVHMYVFGPCNYVYVAIQMERIDAKGKRHVEPMEIISYHDSCWRDAIQNFIFKRRGELSTFRSFQSLSDWCDVIVLSKEEKRYLDNAERWRRDHWQNHEPYPEPNPFDKRRLWKD